MGLCLLIIVITEMDLADDDLNPKESGKCILANDFINGLNRIL